jgi:hypothetical protein
MANKNNGDIGFFGEFNQFCRGFEFGIYSCGRFDIIGMKGLNRINDYNQGSIASICLKILGFGFGKDVVVTGRVILSALIFICFGFLRQKHIKFYRVILGNLK